MFIMLSCSQRALILVLEYVGNFGIRLPPGCVKPLCHRMTGVSKKCMQLTLVSWYVTGTLCCHCWMFSLSDALPMQSYPSKVGFLCVAVQICVRDNLFPTDLFFRMKSVVYVSWLTLWSCSLHSCGMFVLTVEYGLVHRGDCMNCETLYFSFDPAFVWPDLGAQTFTLLSFKVLSAYFCVYPNWPVVCIGIK